MTDTTPLARSKKIVITGAAGLVGQNLILRLKQRGYQELVGIDKHPANTRTLRDLHPQVAVVEADLSIDGSWAEALEGCDVLIHNHAQIGALTYEPFHANNVLASENVMAAAKRAGVPYMIHISSSVVNSLATDHYTESKKLQEQIALQSGIPCCVLRPTLMFGWFDRKHLGWLARFMKRSPVFPIPGHGRYLRQPLYVGDFCNVIISSLEHQRPSESFNITGQQSVDYIDLIKEVRSAANARVAVVKIPRIAFKLLLDTYGLVDKNPPFTAKQLNALMTPDVFEVIDWPSIFGTSATLLSNALEETFQHPVYSAVELEF